MAAWPTSVADDTVLWLAKNNVYSSLNGAIDASVTSVVLTDASAFPSAGFLSVDNEVIAYTGKSTNTLTGCTRGADGTTAASHTSGRIAMHRVVAAHHNALKDELIAVENSLNLTASRLIVTNGSGRLAVSAVTATEAGYLAGVTSAIQTQLGTKITAGAAAIVNADVNAAAAIAYSKLNLATSIVNGDINASAAIAVSKLAALTASRAIVSDGSGFLAVATTTATEIGYVNGVTSAIQTQLDAKAPTSRTLTAAGLVTGGGTLASDRTFTVTAAVQADQETGTSNTVAVTPGVQHYHPSAAKVWVKFDGTGTPAVTVSRNVSSITDNGVGDFTVNYTTAFSSADYAVAGFCGSTSAPETGTFTFVCGKKNTAPAAGSIRISVVYEALAVADIKNICIACWGDL